MSETPFIKFFPGDFLGGVGGLTPAERGVYITLLCLIWDNDGPVMMDDGRLARRCGMPKAAFKKALQSLIDEGKIARSKDGLTNDRAEKTIVDRQNRTRNATHAANARWGEGSEKSKQKQSQDDANAMPPQCVPDAKPEARSQSIGGGDDARAREVIPDRTDREIILSEIGADPISGLVGPNGTQIGRMADMQEYQRWKSDLGLTRDEVVVVIREVMARKPDGPPSTFTYFRQAMQRYAGAKNKPTLTPIEGGANERHHDNRRGGPATAAGRAHDGLIAAFARTIPIEQGGGGFDP